MRDFFEGLQILGELPLAIGLVIAIGGVCYYMIRSLLKYMERRDGHWQDVVEKIGDKHTQSMDKLVEAHREQRGRDRDLLEKVLQKEFGDTFGSDTTT